MTMYQIALEILINIGKIRKKRSQNWLNNCEEYPCLAILKVVSDQSDRPNIINVFNMTFLYKLLKKITHWQPKNTGNDNFTTLATSVENLNNRC